MKLLLSCVNIMDKKVASVVTRRSLRRDLQSVRVPRRDLRSVRVLRRDLLNERLFVIVMVTLSKRQKDTGYIRVVLMTKTKWWVVPSAVLVADPLRRPLSADLPRRECLRSVLPSAVLVADPLRSLPSADLVADPLSAVLTESKFFNI